MFYQRVKAILTGNTGDFPTQIEGLVAVEELELGRAGYDKNKFKNLSEIKWTHKEREMSVVNDPDKRKMVRDFFEMDHITVESELPRSREVVSVEGVDCLRRYYMDSRHNLVTKFLDERPEFNSSRSSVLKILESFGHLRYATEQERIHSACTFCRQLDLFLETINRSEAFTETLLTRDQLVRFSCCDGPLSEVACIENVCGLCKGTLGKGLAIERLESLVQGSFEEEETWVMLAKDENDRETEAQKFGSVRVFINSVAQYLVAGCGATGSGVKPIAWDSTLT